MATFGDRIKSIRTDREVSQEELASLLGTSKQVISRYETNQRTPKITIANEYAQKLGVDLNYLLGADEKEKPVTSEGDMLTPSAFCVGQAYEKATPPVQRTVWVALEPYMPTDTPNNIIQANF